MIFAAAILFAGIQPARSNSKVEAFLSFHQNVLAVETAGSWHDPKDSSKFSSKEYPVVIAGIGRPVAGKGNVAVYKDKDWGWIADADRNLPFDQPLCYGIRPRYLRKVIETGDPRGVYHAAADAIFKSKGFPVNRIANIEIYRVDLRGNGQEEALVAAHGIGSINPATVVFLRQITAKGVTTDVLEFQIMGSPMISAIADFTGDGTLQAVIAGGISDGAMASLWSFRTQKPKKLAGFIWSS